MKKHIQSLEDERDMSVSQSDCLRARVNELELVESELSAKKEQIEQHQVTLRENVGQEEQALLEENSRLNEEKRQLERLSSVKTEQLLAQISDMQAKHERAVEALMQENAQLQSQIESMDKQLKSDRHSRSS